MKPPKSAEVAQLLDDLGLAIGTHQVEIVDFNQAETVYVHHTSVPVAVTAYALVSPTFARGKFPKFTFIDLIHKIPSMDERESLALAAVCGVDVTPPFWGNPIPFGKAIWDVIAHYELGAFFEHVERPYGSVGEHFHMRPRGFAWDDPEQPEIPEVLQQWRRDYRALPPVRQLMVATVLQLYRQGPDTYWMVRVPKSWHAAEAIDILRAGGALQDWCRLCATYPGW